MNKNTLIIIIIISIIFGIVIWIYAKYSNFNPVDKDDLLLQKISELELKIDSLKNQKDSKKRLIFCCLLMIFLVKK